MIKRITERTRGYLRKRTYNQMFCDKCGRKIEWCLPHPKGHYCEKCLNEVKQAILDANS